MQFGVCLPNFPFGIQPSTEAIAVVAQAAGALQYDSVWVSDHVLVPTDRPRYGHVYEALTTLAYVAGKQSVCAWACRCSSYRSVMPFWQQNSWPPWTTCREVGSL